jgi:regulator of protease activity HflC (stomatin/prohibitin superfamily)
MPVETSETMALVVKVNAVLPQLFRSDGSTRIAEDVVAICAEHFAAANAQLERERDELIADVSNGLIAIAEDNAARHLAETERDAANAARLAAEGERDAERFRANGLASSLDSMCGKVETLKENHAALRLASSRLAAIVDRLPRAKSDRDFRKLGADACFAVAEVHSALSIWKVAALTPAPETKP